MKKTIVYILCIVLIIIASFGAKYINYQEEKAKIAKFNQEYEVYLNRQISGKEITTAINRAINNNEQNLVSKDENGFYIENEVNSVIVKIKMIDIDKEYKMETLYNGGMANFLTYYNDINFECTSIQYNKSGKVKDVVFEQKTV